jgi:hypothetical protein
MTNTRMTDTATLADMATLPSDKVKRAVEAGDWAEAARTFEREKKEIRREFAPIALGHSRMISAVLDLLAGMIRERQDALTEKLGEAVAGQDSAGAIETIDKKRAEHSHYQRACVQFLTQLYSYALDIGGPAGLCELHLQTADRMVDLFESWERKEGVELLRAVIKIKLANLGNAQISEDDEKFTITLDPCGSCGRIHREGWYDDSPGHRLVHEPHPMTYGRPDFPVYNTHSAVFHGIAAHQRLGFPHWVTQCPQDPAEPCIQYIYKTRSAVPREYLQSLGLVEVA